ncbi:MAG: 2Fe-2S iron-sulfur cluster-binding protein [Myxococcales bacterium]|jgi:2Fe-2S ferredoxin
MSKVRVRFEPAGLEVEAQAGEAIMDITDANPAAEVPYSCRSATCGTCRVEVLEGGEALSPPDEDELEVLEIFGDSPDRVRLSCQVRIVGLDANRVTLRVCDD